MEVQVHENSTHSLYNVFHIGYRHDSKQAIMFGQDLELAKE